MAFELCDTYGIKEDALVDGVTKFLQQLLQTRSIEWMEGTGLDFFKEHPHQKWGKEEERKIAGRDIGKWDTPLCVKWLLEFPWDHVRKPTADEQEALKNLRNIRNATKHRATTDDTAKSEFEEHCYKVEKSLIILGADVEKVAEIITTARNRVFADRSALEEIVHELQWKYRTNKILGSGSFGVVISVTDALDNQVYAIKIIPNRKMIKDNDNNLRESRNLAKLDHPNVVKYKTSEKFKLSTVKIKEILQWESGGQEIIEVIAQEFLRASFDSATSQGGFIDGLFIKTEICGETLREWLNNQTRKHDSLNDSIACQAIGGAIVDGLNYIHSNGVIHRDLRPDNIFFARSNFGIPVKIGDFGLSNQSKIYEMQTMTREIGNRLYRAPEVDVVHKDGKAKYSQAADLYSLGLVLSEIFDPVTVGELQKKFIEIVYIRDTGSKIQKSYQWLNLLILQLTEREPSLRITKDVFGNRVSTEFYSRIDRDFEAAAGVNNSAAAHNAKVYEMTADSPILRQSPPISSQNSGTGNFPPDYENLTETEKQFMNLAIAGFRKTNGSPTQNEMPAATPHNERQLRDDDDIVTVRKALQQDKTFWTAANLATFLTLVGSSPVEETELPGASRSIFNSKFYQIRREKPHLVTKMNINRVLCQMEFRTLAGKIDGLLSLNGASA